MIKQGLYLIVAVALMCPIKVGLADEAGKEIRVFTLVKSDCKAMYGLISDLSNGEMNGGFDTRTNSLIMVGDADTLSAVEALLMKLDSIDTWQPEKVAPKKKVASKKQTASKKQIESKAMQKRKVDFAEQKIRERAELLEREELEHLKQLEREKLEREKLEHREREEMERLERLELEERERREQEERERDELERREQEERERDELEEQERRLDAERQEAVERLELETHRANLERRGQLLGRRIEMMRAKGELEIAMLEAALMVGKAKLEAMHAKAAHVEEVVRAGKASEIDLVVIRAETRAAEAEIATNERKIEFHRQHALPTEVMELEIELHEVHRELERLHHIK